MIVTQHASLVWVNFLEMSGELIFHRVSHLDLAPSGELL
jgi:hypothetical protein